MAGALRGWWQAQKKAFVMPKQPKRGKYGFARTLAAGDGSTTFFDIPVLSKRCIFQFDFSGSMAWEIEDYRRDPHATVAANEKTKVTKVSIAQDEAAAVVDKLAPDALFNFQIHRYLGAHNPPNEEMLRAFPKLAPTTPKNRAQAKKWVLDTKVDGWGAFYNALIGAIDDDDVDTVFLLTDGKPTGGERVDEDRFIAGILEHNRTRRVTIHAILMKNNDEGYNKYAISFMQEIAAATGGLCVQH